MDAISNTHSVSVTATQVKQARSKLTTYLQKFRNRLKGKNRVYVTQLVRLLDSLISFLDSKLVASTATEEEVQVSDLLTGKGVDQINLYKLMHYLQESKLARKVEGYHDFAEQNSSETEKASKSSKQSFSTPVLTYIQSFLLSMIHPSAEGRFFLSKDVFDSANRTVTLKYLLVDPTYHFKEVVDEARAVVLAGGTMSPVSRFALSLLGNMTDLPKDDRLYQFSIPLSPARADSNALVWPCHSTCSSDRNSDAERTKWGRFRLLI